MFSDFIYKRVLKTETKRNIFTFTSVLVVSVAIISSLFYQPFYKSFLKTIQYGGEIPVEIEYRKADNTDAYLKGLLLLRTTRSITLRSMESKDVSEVPMERVSKLTFLKEEDVKEADTLLREGEVKKAEQIAPSLNTPPY